MKRRVWAVVAVVVAITAGIYLYLFQSNVPSKLETEYLLIHSGSDYEGLVKTLVDQHFIKSESSFRRWSGWMKLKTPRAGRFRIKPGSSDYSLIKMLQKGEQTPVKVILHNEKTLQEVAEKVSRFIESDSLAIIQLLTDSTYLDSIGYTRENLMSVFIPNTYELFWNTSPKGFVSRMLKEHKRFWNDERKHKADLLHFTPEEVYTMASIVTCESNHNDEKPRIAGVYYNKLRLEDNKLRADPTVQFALISVFGGNFRRLTNADYRFVHPYNTYLNPGLPPGPICMATIPDLDAVLNMEHHNYFYFCAKPDNSGYHAFAETYEAHLINAKHYQEYLNQLVAAKSE